MPKSVSSGNVPNAGIDAQCEPEDKSREAAAKGMSRHCFDRAYVQRLTDGDPETERHFTAYFGQLLLIKLRARLRSMHLVDELRQETILRVFTALRLKNSVEYPERLGAFVNSVCNNILLESYRFLRRTQPVDSCEQDLSDEQLDAESALVAEESKQQVRQVLEELPEKDRELLRMLFYEEADKSDICQHFRVDREYLRVLVYRAKNRFRKAWLKRDAQNCQSDGNCLASADGK
jgi:RNA polymerase sigma-70 factor (ECF subfamily)